ncbi:rod shape-determining protein MreD [Roseicyclus sp.]|uniref:rod shape-determining protein MreD n=1 Tax=Roseicyclus sp. TaxID=1914329 RepID=UPI003FA0C831
MSSPISSRHIWTYRALFLVLCMVLITMRLLPLGLGESNLPGPDLILALTFAWLLRQPAVVPLGVIVAVFVMADFLFQRPPGLWTALAVVASESLRRRRLQMTEFPFLVEWGAIAGAVMGMVIAERLLLWMLFLDLPPLGLSLTHGIVTIAIYPVIVAVSKFVFGLRKLGPAELEPL